MSFFDDFNRVDNDDLGPDWQEYIGTLDNNWKIVANWLMLEGGLVQGGTSLAMVVGDTATDIDLRCRFVWSALQTKKWGIVARWNGTSLTDSTYYLARLSNNIAENVEIVRRNPDGTMTTIGWAAKSISADQSVRFRLVGDQLKLRMWDHGTTEPSTWDVEVTDTGITAAGRTGVYGNVSPDKDVFFDDFMAREIIALPFVEDFNRPDDLKLGYAWEEYEWGTSELRIVTNELYYDRGDQPESAATLTDISVTDGGVLFTARWNAEIRRGWGAAVRLTGDGTYPGSTFYSIRMENDSSGNAPAMRVFRHEAGTVTQIGSTVPFTDPATDQRVRAEIEAATLRLRRWNVGATEPAIWDIEVTDTVIAGPGELGPWVRSSANRPTRFDDVEVYELAAAIIQAINQAVENEIAQPLDRMRSVGLAVATDISQPTIAVRLVPIGQPVTTEAAQPLDRIKSIGQALETDLAQQTTPVRIVGIGQPTTLGSAHPLSSAKRKTIGQASEVDAAQQVVPERIVPVGQAVSIQTAQPLAVAKHKTVGQASETETAGLLASAKRKAVGQATESSVAQQVAVERIVSIGQPAAAEIAFPLGTAKRKVIGLASETHLAQPVGSTLGVAIGQATETSVALGLSVARSITQAASTDTALPTTPRRVVPIGLAATTASALSLNRIKTVSQAISQSLAHRLGRIRSIDPAIEIASAGGVTAVNQLRQAREVESAGAIFPALAQAVDTSLAQPLTPIRTVGVGVGSETDIAGSVGRGRGVGQALASSVALDLDRMVSLAQAAETNAAQRLIRSLHIRQAQETDGAQLILVSVGILQAVESDLALAVTERPRFADILHMAAAYQPSLSHAAAYQPVAAMGASHQPVIGLPAAYDPDEELSARLVDIIEMKAEL